MIYRINVSRANKDHTFNSYDEYYDPQEAQKGFNQAMKAAKAMGFTEVDKRKYRGNKTFYNEYVLKSDSEHMEVAYYSTTRKP